MDSKINEIDEELIEELSKKYKIISRVDKNTNIIYAYNGIDEFKIEFNPNTNNAPIDVYHKNCRDRKMRYHKQGYYFNFNDCYKDIYQHKFKAFLNQDRSLDMFKKI